jgi:hypothetical protein
MAERVKATIRTRAWLFRYLDITVRTLHAKRSLTHFLSQIKSPQVTKARDTHWVASSA